MAKKRLDLVVVERGLAPSREKAQALIMAGRVLVGPSGAGRVADKPGALVRDDVAVTVTQTPPYVSRGGEKLAGALEAFQLDPHGSVALDVGASTGGFTDCLLQRGAARVYALDVGTGQLDYRLRQDPRVVVMEKVNAHFPFTLPEHVDLCTIDVSFISVLKVLPNAAAWVKPGGHTIALVKPQFEAERKQVARGGVVKDPAVHAEVLGKVILGAIGMGLRLRDLTPSPLLGPAGNREFFLLLQQPAKA